MPNIYKDDDFIILVKENGAKYTFLTTELDRDDWVNCFRIKFVKVENPTGLDTFFVSQCDLIDVFIYYRNYLFNKYPKFFENMSATKVTALDYIHIKSLDILDWTRLLGNIENRKPFTIRDRIAYARRKGWLPKPGRGFRKVKVDA